MNKRNRILAAALGLVATAGAFDTVENFAILGNENGGARPIVLEPTDGAYKSPTGRKAFLVAADDYGETVNKLPCTKNDLKALKERLEKLGFTTTVLQSDAGPSNAPTKAIIERRFKRFVESLESGDFAIVYLSGHGIQPTNSQEAFFVPVDFDEHDVFETSVSIDDMLVALKESNATFRWTIVDACRDDPTAEASAFKGASKSLGAKTLGGISAVPDSVALLQSCQPGKRSYEGGSLGAEDIENGFFTLSLLEALDENDSKADANEDGVLTFLEMSDYVSRRTNELARTRYGCEQVPNLNGSITNFALLDDLLIDGISKAEWNRADGLYQEACALRRQRRWRDALAKIGAARRINGKRKEYEDAEAEIQAQVDSVAASEKRAEADKLANDAWAAFDLGGEANVEKAIQLMKQSLKLVESVGNRRVLKTFEEELEAIRNPSLSPERLASTASQDSQERPQSSETSETSGESSSTASSSEASGDWSGSYEAGTAKSLDIKGVKYTFRYCPAGTFTMGSSVSEKDRASDETQHKVTLTKDFWLLETEVTQAMWESVIGENPSFFSSDLGSALKARGADEGKLNSDDLAAFTASLLKARGVDVGEPSEGILTAIAATLLKFSDMNTSNFPVDWVNWENCQKFVEKLNAGGYAPEGLVFRLPTEAEWEYACRAGTTTPFFWGSALNGDKANCVGTRPYGTSTEGEFLGRTTEVGSYAPNAWGLRDMHGNVEEWCSDWRGYNDYDGSDQTDPTGPSSGERRVLRGGDCVSFAKRCRSARRFGDEPTERSYWYGFRLVLGREL